MEPSASKCEFCFKEFTKLAYCKRHVKNVHMKRLNDKPTVKHACVLCDKKYNTKGNLQRHIHSVHSSTSKYSFHCDKCSFKSAYKCNLKRHNLKVHKKGKEELKNLQRPFKCNLCNAQYKKIKFLRYHERQKHEIGGAPKTIIQRKCPICKFITIGSKSEQDIHRHFKIVHNISIRHKKLKFCSIEEFFEWKKETEQKTASFFIKKYSTLETKLYRCHRCGIYKKKGANKRHLKTVGSCKIDAFCPAKIKIKILPNCSVEVLYVSKHVGHKTDLKHLHLTKVERINIAIQLALKVPHNDILKRVKNTLSSTKLKRLHLMNKRDIRNIERNINLNIEFIKDPFDPLNIEAWVQDIKMSKDTALLVYKPQGIVSHQFPCLKEEDFLLIFMTKAQMEIIKKYGYDVICIDGTHGLNNASFRLYTLLVLDECREGYPTAFMFTNRGDTNTLSLFFHQIKENMGPLKASAFLSDMEEGIYCAWEKIMGPSKLRLFCSWHVLKAWRTNIKAKIKNIAKREDVYKLLKILMYELEIESFKRLLPQALLKMSLDQETHSFFEYFNTHFANQEKLKCWAHCYRIDSDINGNMVIDNFNKVLKYCYLRGNKVRILENTLCAILYLMKDKIFDLITKFEKEKLASKLNTLKTQHLSSLSLDIQSVSQLSDDKWQVLSSSENECYYIKMIKNCTDCQLVCTFCKSCFHQFVCSCPDHSIRNNMCKHIHLVCQSILNSYMPYCEMYEDENGEDVLIIEDDENDIFSE